MIQSNLYEEFQVLKQNLKITELITVLPTLHIEVQKYFYQFDARARDVVQFALYAQKESLGEITKEPFFLSLLRKESIVEFREEINLLCRQNASLELTQNILEYYQKILNSYREDLGIFQIQLDRVEQLKTCDAKTMKTDFLLSKIDLAKVHIMNREEAFSYLQIKTSLLLSNIVIDALFEDNYYNVLKNIKEMIKFQKEEVILEPERMKFYQMVLEIDSMSNLEKRQFFQTYKTKEVKENFYEDMRKLRDRMLLNLKKKLFQFKDYQKKYCPILSRLFKVDIYNFRKASYYMLVRSLNEVYENSIKEIRRSCYSVISNEKNIYFQPNSLYQYGYNNFEVDMVTHVYERDSFSEGFSRDMDPTGTNRVNRLLHPEELLFASGENEINEVQILNEKKEHDVYQTLKPSVLLAYHFITKSKIKEAKRLNIPLVLVKKSKRGKQSLENLELSLEDIYTHTIFEEEEEMKKRLQKVCKKNQSRL